jgi:type II secretory pathway pseudopilin PulG
MTNNSRGSTLTELMVATAVLSIAVLGLMSAFVGIQKALQNSKSTTLAANLGQEQMQILKQKVYYQILITTNPAYNTNYSPPIEYDAGYFPPAVILEGGVNYTRHTMVEVAREDSGVIQVLPPSTPDTGMKLVTVTVAWRAAGEHKRLVLRTIVANPDTVTANAIFSGAITNSATAAPISGAVVNVAENLGWRDTSNASGVYSINLSPGSFTLGVVVPGFFPAHRSVSINANQTQTQDFALVPMSSGVATTDAAIWMTPNAVISQVVVSTPQADRNNFEAQFVEIYNPTSSTITVGSGSTPNQLKLKITSGCSGANYVTCAASTYGIKLDYVNSSIPPYGYYLIANIGTFTVNGVIKSADAVYADDANNYCTAAPLASYWNTAATPPRKLLGPTSHAANFYITNSSDAVLDAFGWEHGGITSNLCETSCLALPGAAQNEQYVRIVSTYSNQASLDAYGRAYDSQANRVDITTAAGIPYSVYSTADSTKTRISGAVPLNAVVSATDGLSLSTRAYTVGSPPYAKFALTQIATGTWTMLVSSGSWMLQHDTVTIAAAGSVFTLPSTMTYLSTSNVHGFIEGAVTNVLGAAISPTIPIDPGGAGAIAYANTTNGRYLLRVTSGTIDVTANSGAGSSANYVSISSLGVSVGLGEIRSGVNFNLSQGGRISGFVTRDGTNALPGVAVSAIDINGYARDTQVSGSDGRFTTLNISTGFYVVQPQLDEIESVSPSSAAVTVTAGGNVFAATYTVTGALGAITGSVTLNSAPLRTGALIVVTTATLVGSPPAPPSLSSASLVGSPYYIASSQEDGTYRVEVRQSTSTTYRVYAYYITYSGATPTINSLSQTGVGVLAGQTVSGINFAW